MGQALVACVLDADDLALAAALDVVGAPSVGRDAGAALGRPSGVVVTSDLDAALARADVLIDFTRPEGTLAHAAACERAGVALVAGTTGLAAAHKAAIAGHARAIPIVLSANMSVGVNVLADLVTRAARALGEAYDIEIVEMHHRHKVDAPSGTALLLGEAAAAGRHVSLPDVADRGRDGITGARRHGDIGFASLRGGSVAGDHMVVFAGEGERIELGHRAETREIFARGAVKAALWLAGRAPGRYRMGDVLGL